MHYKGFKITFNTTLNKEPQHKWQIVTVYKGFVLSDYEKYEQTSLFFPPEPNVSKNSVFFSNSDSQKPAFDLCVKEVSVGNCGMFYILFTADSDVNLGEKDYVM